MFKKLIKFSLVLIIGFQIIHYFMLKRSIPDWVIDKLETNSCLDYETIGMDLPFSVLFNTETIGTVYLKNKDNTHSVDLEVEIVDTSIPLLKGVIDYRLRLRKEQINNNFLHCYIKKST